MLLHFTPEFVERLYGAGHWKAVRAVRLLLDDLGGNYRVETFDGDTFAAPASLSTEVSDVIIEYTRWPQRVQALSAIAPNARLHARAHNAEALQHFVRSSRGWRPTRGVARTLYGTARLLWQDALCRRRCDSILGISAWDNRHYWNWFPGGATVVDVPYFSPWPSLLPDVKPLPWDTRDKRVLCLAGASDTIGRAARNGFATLARRFAADDRLRHWQFEMSAGSHSALEMAAPDGPVRVLNHIENPWALLCRTACVAVLTPLGYGFKTTILDALAAGCHTIVHPQLLPKLPEPVRRACIGVDPATPDATGAWTMHLDTAPVYDPGINREMREIAGVALRGVLARRSRMG